jgi:hypothetical protein
VAQWETLSLQSVEPEPVASTRTSKQSTAGRKVGSQKDRQMLRVPHTHHNCRQSAQMPNGAGKQRGQHNHERKEEQVMASQCDGKTDVRPSEGHSCHANV